MIIIYKLIPLGFLCSRNSQTSYYEIEFLIHFPFLFFQLFRQHKIIIL